MCGKEGMIRGGITHPVFEVWNETIKNFEILFTSIISMETHKSKDFSVLAVNHYGYDGREKDFIFYVHF